jgi:hypothetical protein
MELFTNQQATEKGEVAISAPAFSITKVQAAIGLLGAAIIGIVPASLKDDQAIIITSIAAVTVVLLGIFMLAAVDLVTRQRAEQAKLRYGSGSQAEGTSKTAVPTEPVRMMRSNSDREYAVDALKVEEDAARLLASRDGEDVKIEFKVV